VSETVKRHQEGRIATLTLNRPEVHNALDGETIDALVYHLRELAGQAKAIVLRGEGKSFCAGADLGYMEKSKDFTEAENLADARKLATLFHEVRTFPGVVLAAVQGATFGGGVGLVAAADVVVASTRAKFSLSEVKLGLVPAVISPFLIARMGEGACRAPVLTGWRFGAEEALRRGLVDRVVEPEELDGAVADVVEQLSACAPEAIRETKALFFRVSQGMVTDVLEDTAQTIARIRVGREAQEGLAAFLEKRPPGWAAQTNKEG
jgi:methylglutaconyl-CoA hydratase